MQGMLDGLGWFVAGLAIFAVFGVWKVVEVVIWLIQHVRVVG